MVYYIDLKRPQPGDDACMEPNHRWTLSGQRSLSLCSFWRLLHWMLFEACTPQKIKKEIAQWFSVELGHCMSLLFAACSTACSSRVLSWQHPQTGEFLTAAASLRGEKQATLRRLWSMLWWIIGNVGSTQSFLCQQCRQVEKEKRRLEEVLRKRNDMVENHKQAAVLRCSKFAKVPLTLLDDDIAFDLSRIFVQLTSCWDLQIASFLYVGREIGIEYVQVLARMAEEQNKSWQSLQL